MTIQEEIEKLSNEAKYMKAVLNNARQKGKWNQMDHCLFFLNRVEAIISIMKEHNVNAAEAYQIADKMAFASSAGALK